MLSEQSRIYQRLLLVADLALIAVGWVIAYYVRFELLAELFPLPLWRPLSRYATYIPAIVVIWSLVFIGSGLYAPDRMQRLTSMVYVVAKAVFFGLATGIAASFFYREFSFSRLHMVIFGGVTGGLMLMLRVAVFWFARRASEAGSNVQRTIIVGTGDTAKRLARGLNQYPLTRFVIQGFLSDEPEPDAVGRIKDLPAILDKATEDGEPIHSVYITLGIGEIGRVEDLMNQLSTRLARVYFVPDLFQFDILNSRMSEVAGLPVLHVIDERPIEFRKFLKRVFDVVLSAGFLIVASPVFLILAILVKLSSKGPVFYRQERMGLNGLRFDMLKFRSMPVTAEAESGPVWAQKGENRATPVGGFMRRTSLDELPQFLNVLNGDMSIVGPRPERPVFIEQFRDDIPGYMLRHKMKSGITGWAQVNGWRGSTSIEKRIEHDLYYIQNWSLKLDIKIMLMTLTKGFVNENAY